MYDVVEHMSGEHGKNYDCEVLKRDWKAAKKVFKCLKCDFTAPKDSRDAISTEWKLFLDYFKGHLNIVLLLMLGLKRFLKVFFQIDSLAII